MKISGGKDPTHRGLALDGSWPRALAGMMAGVVMRAYMYLYLVALVLLRWRYCQLIAVTLHFDFYELAQGRNIMVYQIKPAHNRL